MGVSVERAPNYKDLQDRLGGLNAGFPGAFAGPLFGITTLALTSNQAQLQRFTVPRRMTIDRVIFRVQAGDTADTPVDVGIYDGTTLARLASSGAVLGQLNSAGVKTVNLSAPVILEPGKVYYSAIAPGTITTSVTVQSTTLSNAGFADIIGAAAPDKLVGAVAASHPLPAPMGALGASSAGVILFVREQGT